MPLLNDQEAEFAGDIHDSFHVASDTSVMHRHDDAGAVGDSGLDKSVVQAHGVHVNIDEENTCSCQ